MAILNPGLIYWPMEDMEVGGPYFQTSPFWHCQKSYIYNIMGFQYIIPYNQWYHIYIYIYILYIYLFIYLYIYILSRTPGRLSHGFCQGCGSFSPTSDDEDGNLRTGISNSELTYGKNESILTPNKNW